MVQSALPELVRVRFCTPVLPTSTLPKLTLGGVTESCGCTPVPLRAMVLGELGGLLTNETLPDTLPVAARPNTTLNAIHVPTAKAIVRFSPMRLKPVPETVTCEMLTA